MIPIVPGAIVFDLLNGGDKDWGRFAPYRDLGYAAAEAASESFALGSVGAGPGATTANLKGGLGSASATTRDGIAVAALAVVNAVGSVTIGDGPWFWAAPFETGGRVRRPRLAGELLRRHAGDAAEGRARRDRGGKHHDCGGGHRRRAEQGADQAAGDDRQTGFARAIYPVHAPIDGDMVFAAATGAKAGSSR